MRGIYIYNSLCVNVSKKSLLRVKRQGVVEHFIKRKEIFVYYWHRFFVEGNDLVAGSGNIVWLNAALRIHFCQHLGSAAMIVSNHWSAQA